MPRNRDSSGIGEGYPACARGAIDALVLGVAGGNGYSNPSVTERIAGSKGACGGGDQGLHDDRLLRRANFALCSLFPGRGCARLEIESEVNMQLRLPVGPESLH